MIDDIKESGFLTAQGWQRLLLGVIVALVGMIIGFSHGSFTQGLDMVEGMILGGMLVLLFGVIVAGRKILKDRASSAPEAPSVRRGNNIMMAGGLIGGAIGIVLAIASLGESSDALLSNAPLARAPVLFILAAWLVCCTVIPFKWAASVDEHELKAHYAACFAGLYAYFIVEPGWWLAWRAGLLSEREGMVTFLLVLVVYSAVWFWRRNR